MKSIRIFLVSALAALMCSCANVSSNFAFTPDKGTGLVVGSISYESGLGKYYLIAQNVDSSKTVEFGFGCLLVPCYEPANDAEFSSNEVPKQRGGGFVIEVPEGRYKIVGWRVAQGYMISRSKSPVDIQFLVERGKVSYLGNLHFDEDWDAVQLRDKSGRDLPLLRATYPVLKTAPIAYMIAPGTVIKGIGGEYRRRVEGQPLIPFIPLKR